MKKLEQQGLVVENEMIDFAKLGEEVVVTALDHIVVLTKVKMTALDMVKTIATLAEVTQNLLATLAKNCGTCEDCGHCEEMDTENIKLPHYMLEVAGIPKDAKLIAYAEEDSGIVRVEQAEYDHDIADIPEDIRELLSNDGICMGELDALLVRGELLHG
ncbi:MAG TPA: hypothetical protein DDW34_08370 [Clostridium sp.]|nr:hypothetical protein [Clostridium sp.]